MNDIFAWKFYVGRIFGMNVRVHLAYILVVIPLVLRFSLFGDPIAGTWMDAFLLAGITTLAVLLHEMGHCFGARAVGGEADEIMLWPLGGVAQIGYLPPGPWADFICTLCGPLVNFIFCITSALALAFAFDQSIQPVFNPFTWYPFRVTESTYLVPLWTGGNLETTSLLVMIVSWTFYINWIMFAFNMLAVGIPYDGGHLVKCILWPYVGFHQATMYMITSGFIIAGLMVMASFIWDRLSSSFICLGIYSFYMCRREWLLLESRGEEGLFGYDFSAGYTSLEKDQPAPPRKKQNFLQRWLQKRAAQKMIREQERQEAEELRMDDLLAKIQRLGKDSLTDEETRFLKRVSDRYRNRN